MAESFDAGLRPRRESARRWIRRGDRGAAEIRKVAALLALEHVVPNQRLATYRSVRPQ